MLIRHSEGTSAPKIQLFLDNKKRPLGSGLFKHSFFED